MQAIFDQLTYNTYISPGSKKAYLAEFTEDLRPIYTDGIITGLNQTVTFEETPCNTLIQDQEDLNDWSPNLYNQQIEFTFAGSPRRLSKNTEGKRYFCVVQRNDGQIFIYGIDFGMRFKEYGSASGKRGGNQITTITLQGNSKNEYLKASTTFLEDVILGQLYAPEDFFVEQI